MAQIRKQLATQVNSELAAALRSLAQSEGRQLHELLDEALADLIEKHRRAKPRGHVTEAYLASHEKFASLYKNLAK